VKYLKAEIESRFGDKGLARHSLSVAEFSRRLAESQGRPDTELEKIYLAGLAHDLFKGYGAESLELHVQAESVPADIETLRIGGGLLHGPAAAHYLRSRLGISDTELLALVYYHTTSRADANRLEKIFFCVDYLDPAREMRKSEMDAVFLREKIIESLDKVYREVLYRKIVHTLAKGKALHPNAVAAWNESCCQRV